MSGSVIAFTCRCGAQDSARQYSYDARPPYCMPRLWTTDKNGRGVCPTCSQAKRDATGLAGGDPVRFDADGVTREGVVRAVAIQRYGAVRIVVQPNGGSWRDVVSLEPNQVTKAEASHP